MKEQDRIENEFENLRVPLTTSGIIVEPAALPQNKEAAAAAPSLSADDSSTKTELHARISGRFAAFENRKNRMRHLKTQMKQFEERKMDQAYQQAVDRLK